MDTKKVLKSFGFTEYETKVYLSLVQLSGSKAADIAKHSGVPSNKVYECLIRLAEKGFIASLDTVPRIYKITGVGKFNELLEKQEKEIKSLQRGVKMLQENIGKQVMSTNDVAMVLKGKKKIIQMLDEITSKTKKFQYSFGGNLVFSARSGRTVKQAINRGIEFRFLVHYDPKRIEVYKKWIKIGAKIRIHQNDEQKSLRFSTFDSKVCRITIGKPEIQNEDNYLSFWLESPAFASLLTDQFLEMWKKGRKLEL